MYSKLPYRHISYAAKKTIDYIEGRRSGRIKSLKVSHEKLNRVTLKGFEWGRIITLAGLSGSGKSMIAEQWKRDFVDLNPQEKFVILSFEFEMLATDQIARNISGKLELTTKKLFSAEEELSESELVEIKTTAEGLGKYPIYYIDKIGTVDDVKHTIIEFVKEQKLREEDTGLIVTLDHVLLTHGKQGEAERTTLQNLYQACIDLKKQFDHAGMKVMFILLSQLNREIEDKERILNPKLHFPQRADVFGSSAIFYSSDYVIVTHNPLNLGITAYGVGDKYPAGLPVKDPNGTGKSMIYWHILKNRGGEPAVLMMVEDFKHSKVLDYQKNKEDKVEEIKNLKIKVPKPKENGKNDIDSGEI
jgi:replicative DNA helicase